jgi:hypothetical protein
MEHLNIAIAIGWGGQLLHHGTTHQLIVNSLAFEADLV